MGDACSASEWRDQLRALDLPARIKSTGLALSLRADFDSGRNAHPGVSRLAAETGFGERTVRTALAELRDLGLIERTYHGSRAGRSGLADTYRLVWAGVPEGVDLLPLTREHR